MYHSFFGIDDQAFSIAVNPRYLFMSSQHKEALAHLMYGVKSGGFVMLTGEVGTGKTTIIRALLEQLPDETDVAMVLNPAADAGDLLCSICDELNIAYPSDERNLKTLTDKLLAFLVKNHERGHKTIVLVDEAQLLKVSTLEQIRLLTNLESNTEKLLQIILVGQPELNELLAKSALRQLSQRITARYHLRPLNVRETASYIRHRLRVAGLPSGRQLFPPKVVERIFALSNGIPRVINILCDRTLLGAFSKEKTEVDLQILKQASQEVLAHQSPAQKALTYDWKNLLTPLHVAFACTVVALLAVVWYALALRAVKNAQFEPRVAPVVQQQSQPENLAAQTVEEEPKTLAPPDLWIKNKDIALRDLLATIGEAGDTSMYPCWRAEQKGLKCETLNVENWQEFREINRPAVLYLNTPERFAAYTTIIALDDEDAIVIVDGDKQQVALSKLGPLWTGEFTFMWHKPPEFDGPVGVGSSGKLVRWVAERFASIDGQPQPLTNTRFTRALAQRVKLFQRQQGLTEDGVVGMQTLLRLNEATNADFPLASLTGEL